MINRMNEVDKEYKIREIHCFKELGINREKDRVGQVMENLCCTRHL